MKDSAIDNRKLITNFREYIPLCDPFMLKRLCDELLEESGFNVLGFQEHHFDPQGYTAMWILAESHLAIHTFPEKNTTYLELSSCSSTKNTSFRQKLQLKVLEYAS